MKHISSTICGWTLAVAVLFAAYVACSEEVTLPADYVPVNLVTNVGGSASSDTKCLNSDSGYGVAKAFDKKYYSDDTRWIGHGSTFPQRAVWTFPEGKATIVDTVRIYNANYRGAKQSPSNFTIAGSNDGTTWTTLDTESDVTGWSNNQFRTFGFENTTPYLKYRLEVTAVQDMTGSEGKRLTITEIEIYRVTQASFEVAPSGSPTVGIDTFSTDWNLTVEDGAAAAAGIVWSTDVTFVTASTNSLGTSLAVGTHRASLSGLEPDTTYWWKIYATRGNETKETIVYSFKTFGAPVLGNATTTLNGESATFSVALAEAALTNTLSTSVSVFYGTDGESWTELPLGSASAATNLSGIAESLGYGVTYQWFARATATMAGGRVLSVSTTTNSFTTLWNGDMYVDAAAENATPPYSTPATAAKTIAAALSLATDGATIHVAEGLYKISNPLSVTSAVRILGEDPDSSRVVVSNTVKANYQNGNRRVFVLNHANAFVANLTMKNGSAWGDWTAGGNLYINTNGGTVSNCVLEAGLLVSGHGNGGGATLEAGLITHSTICKSSSEKGSTKEGKNKAVALYLKGASRAENCLIANHHPSTSLTIAKLDGTAIMRNCSIVDGSLTATSEWCTVRSPLVIGANATVQNVVVAGITNTVDNIPCLPTGTRSNFVNGAVEGDITGTSFPEGTVVGTAESYFKDYANGDYTPRSPTNELDVVTLVNAGANYEGMASVDLAGKTRKSGKIVDIGCYEYQMPNGFFIVVR